MKHLSEICLLSILGSVVSAPPLQHPPLHHPHRTEHPRLLVVSYDGFRYDYLDMAKSAGKHTPAFDSLIETGTRAEYVKNTYITVTFPNHYTIATGLYEENHGMVNMHMYDPQFDKVFDGSPEQVRDSKWWNNGTDSWEGRPVWLVNQQKEGQRSGVYFWVGSEAAINGERPYHYLPYNKSVPFRQRIDTVIDWFTDDSNPVNFAMLYFDEPDSTGHWFGPESAELLDQLEELDQDLDYMLGRLKEQGLFDEMNVILTSDHGMVEMAGPEEMIYLDDYTDASLYTVYGESPILHILPQQGQETQVYQQFQTVPGVHVYHKSDLPAEYHYQHNRRILPLLLEAAEGNTVCASRNHSNSCDYLKGDHGFNNSLPKMHPFFIAHGPSFKQSYVAEAFNNTDIYPLMCHLLNVTPAMHDGDLENIAHILRAPPGSGLPWLQGEGVQSQTGYTGQSVLWSIAGTVMGVIVLVAGFTCLLKFGPPVNSRRQQCDLSHTESQSLLQTTET